MAWEREGILSILMNQQYNEWMLRKRVHPTIEELREALDYGFTLEETRKEILKLVERLKWRVILGSCDPVSCLPPPSPSLPPALAHLGSSPALRSPYTCWF